MLEYKDNPRELMLALDRFLSVYFGDRQVEYKPNLNEIANSETPVSLKYFYSFVGKYPGRHGTPLSTQDGLVINLRKVLFKNKLVIVDENQGVWCCGTEVDGNDPPVWVEDDDYGKEKFGFATWKLVSNSLSQFLVTFCLREAIFASKYQQRIGSFYSKVESEEILAVIRQQGYETSLLWQGHYVSNSIWDTAKSGTPDVSNFYVVEDAILIWGDGCATNYKNADRLLTSIQSEFA